MLKFLYHTCVSGPRLDVIPCVSFFLCLFVDVSLLVWRIQRLY